MDRFHSIVPFALSGLGFNLVLPRVPPFRLHPRLCSRRRFVATQKLGVGRASRLLPRRHGHESIEIFQVFLDLLFVLGQDRRIDGRRRRDGRLSGLQSFDDKRSDD